MAWALRSADGVIMIGQGFYHPAEYSSEWPPRFKLYLLVWRVTAATVLRLVPTRFPVLRNSILRIFGATIDSTAIVDASCRIYSPANLSIGPRSRIGPRVDCYNPGSISIGADVTVSQDAFLCTASHDIDHPSRPLVTKPLRIDEGAWVFARAIVLPGVRVGRGAIVAAGAVVTKDVEPFTVVAGNPAKPGRRRAYRGAS
jgi:putative colanic acid biosynthesis acetyltransferase WcaF